MASLSLLPFLKHKRSFCSFSKWSVKQVTKSNFPQSLDEFKTHISSSDFISISLENTGSPSPPSWLRVLPFDTSETAYAKARRTAERFQLLHFAVCPFSVTDSNNLVAHPYNFLLFPRDELNMGMPAYSFSCQTSRLASMARRGFDFNACIYDGISYLSRAQESVAKTRLGTAIPSLHVMKSSSPPSVADTVFVERIRSRIKSWKKKCKNPGTGASKDEELFTLVRNIFLGSEEFRSRPCLTIDVCSERQVQLILEMLVDFSDNLLPLIIPAKGGTTGAVRVVLAKSKEDKDLLEREIQGFEDEESKKIRGFREVIDLISASKKPVISHNCLNGVPLKWKFPNLVVLVFDLCVIHLINLLLVYADFTLIYSKFIASLPSEVDEFASSLCTVFPQILDVNCLMKKIRTTGKVTNIPSAISYLNNHFFAHVNVEIPDRATENEGKTHGLNALRLCYLFTKLCSILKISPDVGNNKLASKLQDFTNIFHPYSDNIQESLSGDVGVWTNNARKVNCEHLVFLWGFKSGMTAGMLKNVLRASHDIFSGELDVKLVDKSCAIVVFWQPGLSKDFLDVMDSEDISGDLKELVSDGLRVACYETYKTVCRLGLWEMDLAESLERALERSYYYEKINIEKKSSEIHWFDDNVINLDDL